MKEASQNFKSRLVYTGNSRFYPVHLNVREIELIICNLLELQGIYGEGNVRTYYRKDKGGKGIDIRIDVLDEEGTEFERERRYSFGINANWNITDVFDHWIFYSSGDEGEVIANTSCEEIFCLYDLGIKEILEKRKEKNLDPDTSPLMEKDDWVCLIPPVICYKENQTVQ